jgi:hypothetical protein
VDLFVLDDSKQKKPSRSGMKPLVAVGGMHVPGNAVGKLEREIDDLCVRTDFPKGAEFKWSPDSKSWMQKSLVDDKRRDFLLAVLALAKNHGATALVVIRDTTSSSAVDRAMNSERDALTMCLERAEKHVEQLDGHALVLADRPSGNRKSEDRFLAECLQTLRSGTSFVIPQRLALVLTSESKHTRLLQAADVIVGSTTAFVSGEDNFSPPIFAAVRTMLRNADGRVGGAGLKLHPDFKYGNLYHWLLGDTAIMRNFVAKALPEHGRPYFNSAHDPAPS